MNEFVENQKRLKTSINKKKLEKKWKKKLRKKGDTCVEGICE